MRSQSRIRQALLATDHLYVGVSEAFLGVSLLEWDATMDMSILMIVYMKLSYLVVLFCYLLFKTFARATVRLVCLVIWGCCANIVWLGGAGQCCVFRLDRHGLDVVGQMSAKRAIVSGYHALKDVFWYWRGNVHYTALLHGLKDQFSMLRGLWNRLSVWSVQYSYEKACGGRWELLRAILNAIHMDWVEGVGASWGIDANPGGLGGGSMNMASKTRSGPFLAWSVLNPDWLIYIGFFEQNSVMPNFPTNYKKSGRTAQYSENPISAYIQQRWPKAIRAIYQSN